MARREGRTPCRSGRVDSASVGWAMKPSGLALQLVAKTLQWWALVAAGPISMP